jgi:hypothetical protein
MLALFTRLLLILLVLGRSLRFGFFNFFQFFRPGFEALLLGLGNLLHQLLHWLFFFLL